MSKDEDQRGSPAFGACKMVRPRGGDANGYYTQRWRRILLTGGGVFPLQGCVA